MLQIKPFSKVEHAYAHVLRYDMDDFSFGKANTVH